MKPEYKLPAVNSVFFTLFLVLLATGTSLAAETETAMATEPEAEAAAELAPEPAPEPATEPAPELAPESATEPVPQPAKKISVSNKWRLECSGNAESDGAVVLRISQQDADPITIEVPIKNRTSENGVAKTIVKVLKANLDKKAFHVERDDGEDVLVKKKGKTKNFGLEIVSNSVKDLRLHLQKE